MVSMETTINSPFGPLLTAMVTPFQPDGAVDFARMEQLAARLIENGSTGLVVAGTTGESPTLTPAEKLDLFRCVKKVAGKVPVIGGTGDNETAFSIEFSSQAEGTGLDGLLLVVPYYSKPSQEGLFQHFSAVAGAVKLPCLLYNIPGRTGRNMDAATTARLAAIPNIVGAKEASGNLTQVGMIRANTPDSFAIYCGDDADTLPMLTLGSAGVISVLSHIAGRPFREMIEAFWAGDPGKARAIHLRLLPVCEALFPPSTSNPAPIKAALQLQGFDCGPLRLPLVACTPAEREAVRVAMQAAQLL